jgi:hypothetical protein
MVTVFQMIDSSSSAAVLDMLREVTRQQQLLGDLQREALAGRQPNRLVTNSKFLNLTLFAYFTASTFFQWLRVSCYKCSSSSQQVSTAAIDNTAVICTTTIYRSIAVVSIDCEQRSCTANIDVNIYCVVYAMPGLFSLLFVPCQACTAVLTHMHVCEWHRMRKTGTAVRARRICAGNFNCSKMNLNISKMNFSSSDKNFKHLKKLNGPGNVNFLRFVALALMIELSVSDAVCQLVVSTTTALIMLRRFTSRVLPKCLKRHVASLCHALCSFRQIDLSYDSIQL